LHTVLTESSAFLRTHVLQSSEIQWRINAFCHNQIPFRLCIWEFRVLYYHQLLRGRLNRVFVLFCKFELLNRIRMHFFLLNQESSPVFYAKFLSAAKYFGLTPHCVEFCDADMSLQSARVLKSSFLLRCTRKTNILI